MSEYVNNKIFFDEIQFWKDSDDSCYRKLFLKVQHRHIFRTWHYIYILTEYNNSYGVCSILALNLTNFDPPSPHSKINNLTNTKGQ